MRDRFLWVGCALYATLFVVLGALKYAVHRNLVDFGIFAQTAASAFGCFCNPIEGSHWAYHFSPILYLAGAAVKLSGSPLALVALQAIAGALAAPPVYALVRARADIRIARLSAVVVWLYPPLAGLIFGDFHENGFAPAAVAWTLYAFDAGSVAGTFAGAAVTLAIKEDQAVFLALAGALGAWRWRGTTRGRVASAVALASAALFAAYVFAIRPHASAPAAAWDPLRFYAWNASDARALIGTLPARLGFVALAFVPLLFLPFGTAAIAPAIAPLGEVLFSRMPTTYTMGTHYAGAWIGYVLVAFAIAVRRLQPSRAPLLLGICIALCVLELALADPLHPGLNLRAPQPRDAALDAFLRRLPPGADVATQEEAYTHLALRDPRARLLPERSDRPLDACFVLLDADFPASVRVAEYGAAFSREFSAGAYVLVSREGAISLYRRAAGCSRS